MPSSNLENILKSPASHAVRTLRAKNYFGLLMYLLAAMIGVISMHGWIGHALELEDVVQLDLQSITNIFGFVAAALVVALSNKVASDEQRESVRQQLYQTLELESVRLFRFEIENVSLANVVWNDSMTYDDLCKDENANLHYQVLQHICQVLNLFEMAVRFRKDAIVHPDVFGSWVIWIYNLCESKIFLDFWTREGLAENYIPIFQEVIRAGLDASHGKETVDRAFERPIDSPETGDMEFRKFMADKFSCSAILGTCNMAKDTKD